MTDYERYGDRASPGTASPEQPTNRLDTATTDTGDAETRVTASPTGADDRAEADTSLLAGVGVPETEPDRRAWHAGADLGLLVLRLGAAVVFGAHGLQKIFGLFGGPGIEGFARYLAAHGFTHTTVLAYITGWTELVGAALLVLGLLTPVAASALLGLLGNAVAVKFDTGFFAGPAGGFEFELTLAVLALALLFTGPGAVALDNGAAWHRKPTAWGVLGVLVATGASVALYVYAHR